MTRKKSDEYFHALPEKLNCAQAILKGFQVEFKISDSEIEVYRAWGGGRAEGGVCGALFAADRLLHQIKKESIAVEFNKEAGGILCAEIKSNKFSCAECVRIADELIDKQLI